MCCANCCLCLGMTVMVIFSIYPESTLAGAALHTGNVWGVTCEWGDDWQLILNICIYPLSTWSLDMFSHTARGWCCVMTSPCHLVSCLSTQNSCVYAQ